MLDNDNIHIQVEKKSTAAQVIGLLSHHKNLVGETLCVPDASKVAWRNLPRDENGHDNENDEIELESIADPVLLGGDSDIESGGDSDIETLQSAEVWTDVETVRMHLAHLTKLKNSYLSEFDHLGHLLRESRRRYLQDVAVEKQTMSSIHMQSKTSLSDHDSYAHLQAMQRYHSHRGRRALLRRQLTVRRAGDPRESRLPRRSCVYSQGSWTCGETAVPLARHCVRHILEDPLQVLFCQCGSQDGGGDPCPAPLIPLPHLRTCLHHTPLPLHLQQNM